MQTGAEATPISVGALEELMAVYFPDRPAGESQDVAALARDLQEAGCSSIDEVRTLLDRNRERLTESERRNPPNGTIGARFSRVGAIRVSMRQDTSTDVPDSRELNLDALEKLLAERFPDREPGDRDALDQLAKTFSATGMLRLSEVAALLERSHDAMLGRECASPPNGIVGARFNRVGAARIALTVDRDRPGPPPVPSDPRAQHGVQLEAEGDHVAAEVAYREADAAGMDCSAEICRMCIRRGDADAIETAFRVAVERGHVHEVFNTGVIAVRDGDITLAEAAYRAADAAGDIAAACNLGILLEEKGDFAGALAAYGRADAAGDDDAACCLGMMLEDAKQLDEAEAAFERAAARGHLQGAVRLGTLRQDLGDIRGAEDAYRRADDLGSSEGAFNLGLLHHKTDFEQAAQAFERAAIRGHDKAAYALGLIAYQHGDLDRARDALRKAIALGNDRAAEALRVFGLA